MPRILWWPINALQAVYTVLWSAFWILAALLARLITGDTRIALAMARHCWAPGLMHGGYMRLSVEGLGNIDPSKSYFFAANHQSIVDVVAVYRALPMPLLFIVKEELRQVPFLGWYISAMGMIFIRREQRQRSLRALEQCRQRLDSGHSILMFPEGTRSRDGRIAPFKPGSFIPAIDTQVAIVPLYLDGPGKILPAGTFSPRPGKIRVVVGQPIATEEFERQDRRELARQVRERILALQETHRRDPRRAVVR